MVKAKLMEAEVYRDLKQDGEAKTAMMKAEKIVKQMGDKVPPEALLALSNGYHDVGKEEKAMDIAKQVVEEQFDNEGLRDQIDDLAAKIGLDADSIINKNQDKIDGLNKRGIALFQSGKLLDAIELFEEAVSEMPNNTSANLNAVQALITYMEQNGKDNAMLNRSRKYLAKFKNLNKKDKRYARYNELQQLHKNLTKS
jgi:tetratricopeptide (TPR) repeat protein